LIALAVSTYLFVAGVFEEKTLGLVLVGLECVAGSLALIFKS
jgi:hypothetical protein